MRNNVSLEIPPVDILEFDEEHEAIYRRCDDLRRALANEAPTGDLQSIVRELATQAANHFTHEERDMKVAGYSHYAWHCRQHLAARGSVKAFEQRLCGGDREAAGELLEYLDRWLTDHIGIADRMLGAFLRNLRRA